jgi:hypothetical protein
MQQYQVKEGRWGSRDSDIYRFAYVYRQVTGGHSPDETTFFQTSVIGIEVTKLEIHDSSAL